MAGAAYGQAATSSPRYIVFASGLVVDPPSVRTMQTRILEVGNLRATNERGRGRIFVGKLARTASGRAAVRSIKKSQTFYFC